MFFKKKAKVLESKSKLETKGYTSSFRKYKHKMEIDNFHKLPVTSSIVDFKQYFPKVFNYAKENKITEVYFKTHIFINHPTFQNSLNAKIINKAESNSFFKKLKDNNLLKTTDFYSKYSFLKGKRFYITGIDKNKKIVTIEILEKEIPIYLIKI